MKPDSSRSMADWIYCWQEDWMENCARFTMTKQTGSSLKQTLLTASSIGDLIAEGYNYVLTSHFQRDFLERRYFQHRGSRFLVGLKDQKRS